MIAARPLYGFSGTICSTPSSVNSAYDARPIERAPRVDHLPSGAEARGPSIHHVRGLPAVVNGADDTRSNAELHCGAATRQHDRAQQSMRFVTHEISGADGMVRGFFLSRSLRPRRCHRRIFPASTRSPFCPDNSTCRAGRFVDRSDGGTRWQCNRRADRTLALADRCMGRHVAVIVIALRFRSSSIGPVMTAPRALPLLLALVLLLSSAAGQVHAAAHLDAGNASHTTLCVKCASFGQPVARTDAERGRCHSVVQCGTCCDFSAYAVEQTTHTAFQSRAPPHLR